MNIAIIVGASWQFFFFFKQKTAYEITEGDWSSDVCSSDLDVVRRPLECLERLEPVRSHVGAVPQFLEDPQCDLLVHWIVLSQEDPQRRGRGRLAVDRGYAGNRLRIGEHAEQRVVELRRPDGLGQLNVEVIGRACL